MSAAEAPALPGEEMRGANVGALRDLATWLKHAGHVGGVVVALDAIEEIDRLTRELAEARAALARVREAAKVYRDAGGAHGPRDVVGAALATLPQEDAPDERVAIVCGKRLSGIRACGLPPGHDNGIHDAEPPPAAPSDWSEAAVDEALRDIVHATR